MKPDDSRGSSDASPESTMKEPEQLGVVINAGALFEYETEHVMLFSYYHVCPEDSSKQTLVRVLVGPRPGTKKLGVGKLLANGEWFVSEGFAYMSYDYYCTTSTEQAPVMPGSKNARDVGTTPPVTPPAINTDRVKSVGKGTAWAVEVIATEVNEQPVVYDRVYFVVGGSVECASTLSGIPLFTLDDSSRRTFTQVKDLNDTGTTPVFSPETNYYSNTGSNAYNFADYVNGYCDTFGMPRMLP